jgi:hypothetical protein
MGGRAPFPNRDADANDYFARAVPYLNTNALRLKIDPGNMLALNAYFLDWKNLFPLSQDNAQRTSSISLRKDDLHINMEKLLRDIYRDIPASLLITADFSALNLKKRSAHRSRHGKPSSAPKGSVARMTHLQHVLRITNPLTPETQAKPKGVKFIEVWMALVDTSRLNGPWVPDTSAFTQKLSTGRFLAQIDFHLNDVGKTAFYFTRWVNGRGEAGPESEIFMAIVA